MVLWTITDPASARLRRRCHIRIVDVVFQIDRYLCSAWLKILWPLEATTVLFVQFLHLHLILLLRRSGKHRAYCLHKIVKHAFMLIIAAVTTLLRRLISCAF